MNAARKKITVLTLRDTLKWFIAEYRNFDVATRLCADYCITAEELDALTKRVLKRRESKSHLTFVMRSSHDADEALLAAP